MMRATIGARAGRWRRRFAVRTRRTKGFDPAIRMRNHLRMDHATVETALHRHTFVLVDNLASVAARSCVDQRSATIVLNDELVAKDFGDLALHGDGHCVFHLGDRCGLQQHHGLRMETLDEVRAAYTCRGAGHEGNQKGAGADCAARG
ncbi:MAG TPA: hypothetical protein VL402_12090 [Xanthobacteraceae bacterium]|jgi:hypothetical protein|nr:hypothetical protein [Xanthobacteraceae bacterium]